LGLNQQQINPFVREQQQQFENVATGAGITYQWRKGTTILTNGGSISGATTATLTINPAVSSDSASDYNVVITGTAPCKHFK
jgi:hypothetical protein